MKLTTYEENELLELKNAYLTPPKVIPTVVVSSLTTKTLPPSKPMARQAIVQKNISLASFILIVDDSDFIRKVLRTALKEFGFSDDVILEAKDGEEAIEVTMEFPNIELLITDINMPKIGGLELTQSMRANKEFAALHIWIISAELSDSLMKEFQKYHVEFLPKPFKKPAFFTLLHGIVKNKENNEVMRKKQIELKKKVLQTKIATLEEELKNYQKELTLLESETFVCDNMPL